ncbi:SDR family NAD(P)-dependent oxidoreductase [Sphingorhabdus sp.]|uniref:SDR family NAD(P)-dependent oxidoreductase n=1 Tax=Sphingorhabdus sp. TaxID=1902408 RepID=UPI0037C743B6
MFSIAMNIDGKRMYQQSKEAARMASFDLSGRVALVTGGTSGIGKGIALGYAAAGASVAVCGNRNIEAGVQTVAELEALGARAKFYQCDVRDPERVDALVAGVVEDFGGLHIAVNNAMQPAGASSLFDDRAVDGWRRSIDGFLSAPFWCCRAEARHMKDHGGGAIINIASIGGHRVGRLRATTGLVAYGTSKAALLFMTKSLARDWARYGIRVNSISPGLIETPATEVLTSKPESVEREIRQIPLGRVGVADDIAGAALYLASDAASYATGIDILVDGGSLIG